MELAGLEPATSWVRSSCPLTLKVPLLRRFVAERLDCRNISRSSLQRVLRGLGQSFQRKSKRAAGERLHRNEGVDGSSPAEGFAKVPQNGTFHIAETCTISSVRWVWSHLWSIQV
jgi:hypothetical protein